MEKRAIGICFMQNLAQVCGPTDHWTPPTCSLMLSEADPSDYQKSSVIAEEYSLFPSASPDYGFLGLRSSPAASRAGGQSGTEEEDDCCDSSETVNRGRSRLNGSRGGRKKHEFLIRFRCTTFFVGVASSSIIRDRFAESAGISCGDAD